MAPKRPPSDIAPSAFFEAWLPAHFQEEFGGGRAERVGGAHVRVRLDGEGGGAWDLKVEGGKLHARPPSGGEAPVTVLQTVPDWRAVTVGEEGAPLLSPPRASALDILFLDPALRQLLGVVRGTLRFEVLGYQGRTFTLTAKLGDQPLPADADAVITIDADTYVQLLEKKIAPPEAYFGGKIKITGNTGLAMQLAMALLPRFIS